MFDKVSTGRSKEKPQTQQHFCSLIINVFKDCDLCMLAEKSQALSACSKPSPSCLPEKSHLSDSFPDGGDGLVSERQVHLLPYFLFSQGSAKAPKCTIDYAYTYFTFPSLPANTLFSQLYTNGCKRHLCLQPEQTDL